MHPTPSKVYMANTRTRGGEGPRSALAKIPCLLDAAAISSTFQSGDPVAIKMHLGSGAGFRTIRPEFVRKVVDRVRSLGGRPFVAETCRPDALQYLEIANERGYNQSALGCPVMIVDGFKGEDSKQVQTYGEIVDEIQVASGIYHSPSMIVLTHVTGHGNACYGGALKNLAMGCVDRMSKGKIHRAVNVEPPIWHSGKCAACGDCASACNYGALRLVEGKPVIDSQLCERCMRCARACTRGALIRSSPVRENFMQAIVDSARGVLSTFEQGRVLFLNFLMEISPECDCAPSSDNPIVPDMGILASKDIVALEQASLDLITQAPALPGSVAADQGLGPGDKKFAALHGLDPQAQVDAAERAGLGTRSYEIVPI